MMEKNRLMAIKRLIGTEQIPNQEKLVERLHTLYGIKTSQAVVSRDLEKLGVTKRKHKGTLFYETPHDPTREILRLAITNIEHNEHTIVVHTITGLAPFVGDFLDLHKSIGILGTIAGENVVFVAPTSIHHIQHVAQGIKKLCEFKT
jgi:transcriptional regulator of arginine metabolism